MRKNKEELSANTLLKLKPHQLNNKSRTLVFEKKFDYNL